MAGVGSALPIVSRVIELFSPEKIVVVNLLEKNYYLNLHRRLKAKLFLEKIGKHQDIRLMAVTPQHLTGNEMQKATHSVGLTR